MSTVPAATDRHHLRGVRATTASVRRVLLRVLRVQGYPTGPVGQWHAIATAVGDRADRAGQLLAVLIAGVLLLVMAAGLDAVIAWVWLAVGAPPVAAVPLTTAVMGAVGLVVAWVVSR